MKLDSAATEQGHFSHTPRAASPAVAAVGRICSRDISQACSYKPRIVWWCERESGWTPCRTHEHLTVEAAVECWDAHFLSARR